MRLVRRAFPLLLGLAVAAGGFPSVAGAEIEEVVIRVKGAMICTL